ncbi:hypothetical protein [Streptomyces sp. cg35]|uniref:hypothetical protein n=1 Tax=Streptomyces sp. cg35 TaxID=3421650 RepID=UPI003D1731F3
MSAPRLRLRLWRPEDFIDRCETCNAPPGSFCYPHCDVGYTAEDHQRAVEREKEAFGE